MIKVNYVKFIKLKKFIVSLNNNLKEVTYEIYM